jgi:hypothetical protein
MSPFIKIDKDKKIFTLKQGDKNTSSFISNSANDLSKKNEK